MTYEMFLGTLGLLIAAATAFFGLRQLQQLVAQVKIAVKANSLSQLRNED